VSARANELRVSPIDQKMVQQSNAYRLSQLVQLRPFFASSKRECLDYDPATKALTWRARPRDHFATARAWATWNTRYAGTVAGSSSEGYFRVQLTIDGQKRHLWVHRVVFALERGYWPPDQVDHKDGPEAGNGIDNLREATVAENGQNQKISSDNTSGFPNVFPDRNKWRAVITVAGRKHYLGLFDTAERAFMAVCDAKAKLHPFQPEHRGLSEAVAAVEAGWWFDRRRWREIV
jgi:hypothetical protein